MGGGAHRGAHAFLLPQALIVLDNADHSGIRSALAQMQAYYEVVGNDTKRDRIAKVRGKAQ